MRSLANLFLCVLATLPLHAADPKAGPEYTSDGRLRFPEHYREWVYLSSGIGMTYGPLASQAQGGPQFFDNIFVNPDAYSAYLQTGRWPDKTILVMEARHSESQASINNGGHFQTDVVGVEAEVKDSSTPEGPWNFYGFTVRPGLPIESAKAVSHNAGCYSCHGVKTAVENTFVQFYPLLYDVAERMGTFNPGFDPLPVSPGKLINRIRTGGWSQGAVALEDASRRAPDSAIMNLDILNQEAYRLMNSDLVGDAVSLLEWAAARYPASANVQDSLAEASERFGMPWLSRAATERALKLLPDDKSLSAARRERLTKAIEERLKRLPPSTVGQQWPKIEFHGGVPSVSPDGTRIAFISDRSGARNVFLVRADGSGEARLTQGSDQKSPPAWDKPGQHIIFSSWADARSRIYAMEPDGSNQREIGTTPGRNPALSPDGKSLLYADRRLYIATPDSQAQPITTGVAQEFDPVWSPDGKQIAFVRSGPNRKLDIWVMDAVGAGQRQLTHIPEGEGQPEWPVWSPDGRRIAIQVGDYTPQRSAAHIWIVDAATGEARKLAAHAEPYLDETPSWFPDGTRLAFQSNRTGRMEIWTMQSDGTGAHQITNSREHIR